MKIPRDYQKDALNGLFHGLFNKEGHPLLVAPVGSGKSLICAEIIKYMHSLYPNMRIIVLTHVKELLVQNADELRHQYPSCDVGFYCAGLGHKKLYNDVTFASIQSIGKKASSLSRPPSLIIIDEVHLVSHKATTLYRKFINDCIGINPKMKIIGLTGTPFRSDTGRLDEGKDKIFDYIAHEIPMTYMIENGWWAKPSSPKTAFKMDTSNVPMRGDDFREKELQDAINKPEITEVCVKELIQSASGRKKWLIFTAGIQHASEVTDMLLKYGVSARFIHSDMDKSEVDKNIQDHKDGLYTALVNVAKLTVGYNDPTIDLIAILRPMRSPVLYIQVVGRGVRPIYADGYDLSCIQGRLDAIANSVKPDVLIVDFGGVVDALGAIDQIDIRKKYDGEKEEPTGDGQAITKICPECETECSSAQKYCYNCSHCFISLNITAGNQAIVSIDIEPEWFKVFDMQITKHIKKDSMPTAKVSYYTMSGIMREWIAFEHHTFDSDDKRRFGWDMAQKWHNKRFPNDECPMDVESAIEFGYKKPSHILAKKVGQYWNVIDSMWDVEDISSSSNIKDAEFFDIPF